MNSKQTKKDLEKEMVELLLSGQGSIYLTNDDEEDELKGTPLGFIRDLYQEFIGDFVEEHKRKQQMMPYHMREFVEKMETEYDANKKRGEALLKDYLGIGRTGGMLSEEEKQKAYENYFKPPKKEVKPLDVILMGLEALTPPTGISFGLRKMLPISKTAPEFISTGIKRAYHPLYEIMRHQNIQKIKGLSEKLAKETDPEMIDFLKSLIKRYE